MYDYIILSLQDDYLYINVSARGESWEGILCQIRAKFTLENTLFVDSLVDSHGITVFTDPNISSSSDSSDKHVDGHHTEIGQYEVLE